MPRHSTKVAATILCALVVLAASVNASTAAAKDKWIEVRSKNFLVVGNANEKDVRQVATRLEQFREIFSRLYTTARLSAKVPTTVVVFKNRDSYKPFNRRNSAGYFQAGEDLNYITLTAERGGENPYGTIFHEYVHLLVDNNMPGTPLWLNEGLAEYYSTFDVEDDDKKVIIGKPVSNHVLYLREQKLLPLRTLFAVDHDSPHYNESGKRGVFYAESWALVHYFLWGKDGQRKPQFVQFLQLLNQQKPVEESFRQAFQTDFEQIEKELRDYIRNDRYTANVFTAEQRLEFDAQMQSAALTEAATQAHLGDLLLHTHDLDAADVYLQRAVSLDPAHSMANASLGMLRMRQQRHVDAKQHLERAIASSPQSYLAYYYLAEALSREVMTEGQPVTSIDPARAAAMRAALKKSIALDSSFTASYSLLALVNLVTEQDVDETIQLLARALSAAPGKKELSFMLGQLYLSKHDYQTARQILEPLARTTATSSDDHERQINLDAQSMLKQLTAIEQSRADSERRMKEAREGAAGGTPPAPPRLKRREETTDETTAETPDEVLEVGETIGSTPSLSTLRPVAAGEEQKRAQFVRIECQQKTTIFHFKVGDQLLRLVADDFASVKFVGYTSNMPTEMSCDSKNMNFTVLVTYRPLSGKKLKTNGELVAVDFVPEDWK